MDIRAINEMISVSSQILASDMAAIKAAGFRAVLCNRPDGEAADQPGFGKIAAAARAAGLEAAYVPVSSAGMTAENIVDFGAVMGDLPQPVLAYCRSGARSAALWSMHAGRAGR